MGISSRTAIQRLRVFFFWCLLIGAAISLNVTPNWFVSCLMVACPQRKCMSVFVRHKYSFLIFNSRFGIYSCKLSHSNEYCVLVWLYLHIAPTIFARLDEEHAPFNRFDSSQFLQWYLVRSWIPLWNGMHGTVDCRRVSESHACAQYAMRNSSKESYVTKST